MKPKVRADPIGWNQIARGVENRVFDRLNLRDRRVSELADLAMNDRCERNERQCRDDARTQEWNDALPAAYRHLSHRHPD
ncbi:MAG: hypothetical protein ACREM6_13085 [Vulcanimicrobiaceae bacterium]